jgi:hypothetical protein
MARPPLLATKIRDQEALSLRRQGVSLNAIARHLGVTTTSVWRMIERAIRDNARSDAETERALIVEKLDAAEQELWQIIKRKHYVTSVAGQLIPGPDGSFLIDDGPVIQAIGAFEVSRDRVAVR